MLSSKNRFSQLIIASILAIFTAFAIFLQPNPSHPYIVISASEDLQVTFLLNQTSSKDNCEDTLATLTSSLLAACPSCRIQELQCLQNLLPQHQIYLSDAPLPLPSASMPNGIVIYSSQQPNIALAACQESAKQSALNLHKVTCHQSNTLRTAQQKIAPKGIDLLAAFLTLAAAAIASWFTCFLIIRYEHLHAHLSHDHNNAGPQKFHASPHTADWRAGSLCRIAGRSGDRAIYTPKKQAYR